MSDKGNIAIIAGKGALPLKIADKLQAQKQGFCVVSLIGDIPELQYLGDKFISFPVGQVGSILEFLRKNNVKRIVNAGKIERPILSEVIPDVEGAVLLARLLKSKLLGDDKMLRAVEEFIKEKGFELISATEIVDDLVEQEGVLTERIPTSQEWDDIKLGFKILACLGEADIGQSIIASQGNILGVEAVEGTDELIKRCSKYQGAKGAVLAKAMKSGQSKKSDIPTIGLDTINAVSKAGFAGIAVEASQVIILDKAKVIELANKKGIFVVSYSC